MAFSHEPLVAHQRQRAHRHRTAKWIPTVRAAVRAGLDRQHHVPPSEHARDRVHATRESFAQQHHIRLDPAPLVAQHLPRARNARLYLIADEQNVVLVAQRADLGEVVVCGDHDAGFALNGLDENGADLGAVSLKGRAQGGDVVVG